MISKALLTVGKLSTTKLQSQPRIKPLTTDLKETHFCKPPRASPYSLLLPPFPLSPLSLSPSQPSPLFPSPSLLSPSLSSSFPLYPFPFLHPPSLPHSDLSFPPPSLSPLSLPPPSLSTSLHAKALFPPTYFILKQQFFYLFFQLLPQKLSS